MPLYDVGKVLLAQRLVSAADGLSLHTADPGSTAAHEVSGGGYARRPSTLARSGNSVILGSPVDFSVPTGTVTWVGIWQNRSSSNPGVDFMGAFALDDERTFVSDGILTLDALTVPVNSS